MKTSKQPKNTYARYAPRYFETIFCEDGFSVNWGLFMGNVVASGSGFVFLRKSYWRDLLSSAVSFVRHIKGWKVLSRHQMKSLTLGLKVFATNHFNEVIGMSSPRRFPEAGAGLSLDAPVFVPSVEETSSPPQPSEPAVVPSGSRAPQREQQVHGYNPRSVIADYSMSDKALLQMRWCQTLGPSSRALRGVVSWGVERASRETSCLFAHSWVDYNGIVYRASSRDFAVDVRQFRLCRDCHEFQAKFSGTPYGDASVGSVSFLIRGDLLSHVLDDSGKLC